jgi:hypothetical protein
VGAKSSIIALSPTNSRSRSEPKNNIINVQRENKMQIKQIKIIKSKIAEIEIPPKNK